MCVHYIDDITGNGSGIGGTIHKDFMCMSKCSAEDALALTRFPLSSDVTISVRQLNFKTLPNFAKYFQLFKFCTDHKFEFVYKILGS